MIFVALSHDSCLLAPGRQTLFFFFKPNHFLFRVIIIIWGNRKGIFIISSKTFFFIMQVM